LELRGNDSDFSGGLTVNAGTVTTGAAFDDNIVIGTDVGGDSYLGTGAITVNTGGTLTTTQNVAGGTTGFDFTLGGGGTLTNNGGTITITNAQAGEFDADLFLNGTITSSGGTTQFIDWNDMEVTGTTTINVSGGTTTFNLTDDFNNATPNSNVLNINVTGSGIYNVNLSNAESSSTFEHQRGCCGEQCHL
jgi:fibronectin-binding autotransporter adhesin